MIRGAVAAAPLRAALAAALLVLVATGCGGDEETEATAGLPAAGGGGVLTYAVPGLPRDLDPLAASRREEALITRQVHEPLVGALTGPYGDMRRRPGLALSVRPSGDRTVWTVRLRRGVRFQDSSRFNASAVIANSRRWLSTGAGQAVLPDLFAVDAPRPNEVRFVLDAPARDLPRRLASSRLGIVSPQALQPSGGEGARFLTLSAGTGTGPFELTGRSSTSYELARNASWWGSREGLGPALDGLAFTLSDRESERLRLLRSGEAEVAEPLGRRALKAVAADPLLVAARSQGAGIGLQGSVRGLKPAPQPRSLSSVWLTTLGP